MKTQLKDKARVLRKNGNSIKSIAKQLTISPSTASVWVKDVELTNEQKEQLHSNNSKIHLLNTTRSDNCRRRRLAMQQIGRKEANSDPLHIAGCMLYWAEGRKDRRYARLGNMDPELVRQFVLFLKQSMLVPAEDIIIRCTHHGTRTNREVGDFWLNKLGLKSSSLKIVDQYKKHDSKKSNRHEFGFCSVEVYDVNIVQRIYGSIKAYVGISDNRWLG